MTPPLKPTPLNAASGKPWGSSTLYLICTGLLLIVSLLTVLIVTMRIPQIEDETFANLNAIAQLNSDQIEGWIKERDADLEAIAKNALFIEHVAKLQTIDAAKSGQALRKNLDTLRNAYDYRSILLLDTKGMIVTESNSPDRKVCIIDKIKALLPTAAAGAKVRHSELILCDKGDPVMGFVIALFQEIDREQILLGYVIAFASLEQYSFPNIERWPTASRSGETLLLQRNQDEVLYLSPLRHKAAPPLSLRVPLTRTELPAVRAVLDDKAGQTAGIDYRNETVLSAYHPIAGTSWLLLAKIDRAEVLAPLWHTVFWLVPIALTAVLAIMWALLKLWRQREEIQRYLLQVEHARSSQIEQHFFNMPFIGMVIVDPQTRRFLKFNEQICAITGYTHEELLETTWQHLTHPKDLAVAYEQIKRVVRGEVDSSNFEQRIMRKDGSVAYVNADVKALRTPHGHLEYLIGTAQDITARKMQEMALSVANTQLRFNQAELKTQNDNLLQAQDALRSSIERYEAVSRTSNDAMINSDSQGIIVSWNPGSERIFGYTREEIIGRPMEVLVPERHRKNHLTQLERTLAGYSSSRVGELLEFTALHKDGHEFSIDISLSRWEVTEGVFYTSTIRDITQRKKTEETLNMLSEAIRQSPESVVITNTEARIEFVNEAFTAHTGYTKDEVIGKNPRILKSEKTPHGSYIAMWECLKRGESWKGEFYNHHKNGSLFIEFATVAPIKQADGTITHYVAVKEDITEKKRLGEELDNYRFHLEDEVDRRTAQLAEARVQADAANVAKSAFLANMSHEIRTPMNAIVGLTHLLRSSDPTPRQLDRLIKIEGAAEHLLALINNILDLSKIEAEKMELDESDFNIEAVFDNVRSMVNNQAREKRLPIVLDLDGVPRWLRGDAARLRQALLNYAANAVKFTEHGEVTLRARLLEEDAQGLMLRFEVEDTGIGVAPGKINSLFKLFQQADASTTRKYGGTGLGLAITMKLAELMGGEVGVDSEPGRGSVFWFSARLQHGTGTMPAEEEPIKSENYEDELRRNYKGLKILLADDVDLNLEVAQLLLHGIGLQVDSAKNGREAVDKVRTSAYDLILMDVQMPVMNGLDAALAIRELSDRSQIPIVAMTANAFDEDRNNCLEAGMNDFLTKPVNPETLYQCLLKWLPRPESANENVPDKVSIVENSERRAFTQRPPSYEATVLMQRLARIPGLNYEEVVTRLRGNEEKFGRLVELFLREHADDCQKLSAALSASNYASIEILAHSLKGSASLIGAREVAELANNLLRSIRQKEEISVIEQASATLAVRLKTLISGLQHAVNHDETLKPPCTLDKDRCLQVLARLEQLLEDGDMEANALAESESPLFQATLGDYNTKLLSAIQIFDYAQAIIHLRAARSTCLVEQAGIS